MEKIGLKPIQKVQKNQSNHFKVYRKRWIILLTIVLLNISNAATWISFFPVSSITANFFEKPSSMINWFSTVFMIVPALCFVVTTYLSNRMGLKFLVHVGSAFNVLGALIKSFGTSSLIHDKNNQYIVSLLGQTIAAVAQTFSIYLPTKVSGAWFPENERRIATMILAFAYSAGLTLTQLTTPLYVKTEDDIPTVVFICLGLAVLVQVLTLIFVTSSHPKTPPSESAKNRMTCESSYIDQFKNVFSSLSFVLVLIMISCGIGCIAGLNTLTEQIICNVGYSNEFAGACIAIMYGSGYVGAALLHLIFSRHEIWNEMLRTLAALSSLSFILACEFLVIPGQTALLGLSFALFGIFSTGSLPIGLEFTVELTYPVDESLTTGLIYFFGQIFAIIVITFMPSLARETDNNKNNVCGLNSGETTLDYSISVSVLMVIFCLAFASVIVFFKPVYKRRDFENSKKKELLENASTLNDHRVSTNGRIKERGNHSPKATLTEQTRRKL